MTYDQDPSRWTASPDEAPELLRGAFAAARNEGPSQTQMRSLALKIAAVSAGGAVAIGAANAGSTAQVAASAATWSISKVIGVVALAGSVATGAVVWQQSADKQRAARETQRTTVSAEQRTVAEAVAAPSAAESQAPAGIATRAEPAAVAAVPNEPGAAVATGADATRGTASQSGTVAHRTGTSEAAFASARPKAHTRAAQSAHVATPEARTSTGARQTVAQRGDTAGVAGRAESAQPVSEIELLRRAQLALRGRPREAYQLTEQHRQLYPKGEFAQERDALAIQALLRAGETDMARDLATSFIKAHPTSPHAHRFREAMGIR